VGDVDTDITSVIFAIQFLIVANDGNHLNTQTAGVASSNTPAAA